MFDPKEFDNLVRSRVACTADARKQARRHIAEGKALAAEPDVARTVAFTRRLREVACTDLEGAETIQGDADYVEANFLPRGSRKAMAVAMVARAGDRSPLGTGFMISPRLFITNNHVLLDAEAAGEACIVFDYELDPEGRRLTPTAFRLDPRTFFFSDSWQGLDFSIVAVGARIDGNGDLATFGHCRLSDSPDRHVIGAVVNLVEHPNGALKKLVLRENHIVARGESTLHYEADTEPGSSGSLVCNDAWEPVALHHWGKPRLETRTADGVEIPISVNEGIRVSAIVEKLREYLARETDAARRALLAAALAPYQPATVVPQPATEITPPAARKEIRMSTEDQPRPASATVVLPLEVTFRFLPGSAPTATVAQPPPTAVIVEEGGVVGPERIALDLDYRNRRGYDPAFLKGFKLPLPKLPSAAEIAPLNSDQPDAQAGELKYEHFSVVLDRKRRMALFTATNIDGATYIDIDRETGLPKDAEASETWFDDPRIDRGFHLGQGFYAANSAYFDRGHLTRRSDPTWGTRKRAIRANADTFHRSNCTPQHWLFNQSVKYWQGVERYYLEDGATLDHSRLTVLQGPVFRDDDPVYRDEDGGRVRVPLQFWKIIVRVSNGELKATALLVSQAKIINRPRRGGQSGGDEASDVGEFLCSVEKIERLTGLRFGVLRSHDTFETGAEGAEASDTRAVRGWSDFA